MPNYLVAYQIERAKEGHKGIFHKRVVNAETPIAAIVGLLTINPPRHLYQISAEWVGDTTLEIVTKKVIEEKA